MHKPRVAIITHGGIGTGPHAAGAPITMRLVEALSMNHDITVYSLEQFNPSFVAATYNTKSIHYKGRLSIKMLLLSIIIIKDHIRKPYQLFHGLWGFPGGLLATVMGKMFRKKTMTVFKGAEVVNLPQIGYGMFGTTWNRQVIKWVAKHADCIVAQSNFHEQKIKAVAHCKAITVIPGGIDTNRFQLHANKPKAPYQFLHVANLNAVKDQATLLKAFKIIQSNINAQLHIAGMDTLNGSIAKLVKELSLEGYVYFHGLLRQEELVALYERASIFLLTSLSESQAVVVNEAMAAGAVVCGTRVGLIADLEGKATIAVDLQDADGLAEKVLGLLKDENTFKQMQQNGLAWAKQHDIDWTVNEYTLLYNKLLNNA